jgi:ferredoxin
MKNCASGAATAPKSAPRVFELIDEKSNVTGSDNCGTCNCHEAIDTCPMQAMSWEE